MGVPLTFASGLDPNFSASTPLFVNKCMATGPLTTHSNLDGQCSSDYDHKRFSFSIMDRETLVEALKVMNAATFLGEDEFRFLRQRLFFGWIVRDH